MMSSNNMTILLAAIISMHTLRKAVMHRCVIQLTVNYTLALKNSLNALTCMVDLTCLQLHQTILNSYHTLGASVQ